jgi:hypothetical protein
MLGHAFCLHADGHTTDTKADNGHMQSDEGHCASWKILWLLPPSCIRLIFTLRFIKLAKLGLHAVIGSVPCLDLVAFVGYSVAVLASRFSLVHRHTRRPHYASPQCIFPSIHTLGYLAPHMSAVTLSCKKLCVCPGCWRSVVPGFEPTPHGCTLLCSASRNCPQKKEPGQLWKRLHAERLA